MAEIRILGKGRFLQLLDTNSWEYVERTVGHGVVVIVAVTDDNEMVFVEQFRPALGKTVIELPAGLVGDGHGGPGESFETAGARELLEETGYSAKTWAYLTEGPSSCGMSSEIVTFYVAGGLTKVHDGGGVEAEDITVHTVPLAEVDAWLEACQERGALIDPKIYVGLYSVKG